MRRSNRLLLVAFLIHVCCATAALAKEPIKVLLKDGTTIEGVLIKETSTSTSATVLLLLAGERAQLELELSWLVESFVEPAR